MFDADGSMTADQLVIAPELAGLDPETDDEVIRAALPFAYVDAVEAADAVADVPIEAIYGGSPLDDESVVFLANGVNLHYQPAGARAVLRLITNDQTEAARRLARAVHARRR